MHEQSKKNTKNGACQITWPLTKAPMWREFRMYTLVEIVCAYEFEFPKLDEQITLLFEIEQIHWKCHTQSNILAYLHCADRQTVQTITGTQQKKN